MVPPFPKLHNRATNDVFPGAEQLKAKSPGTLLKLRNRLARGDYGWRNIPISNNVGRVKQSSSTLQRALGEERHFYTH